MSWCLWQRCRSPGRVSSQPQRGLDVEQPAGRQPGWRRGGAGGEPRHGGVQRVPGRVAAPGVVRAGRARRVALAGPRLQAPGPHHALRAGAEPQGRVVGVPRADRPFRGVRGHHPRRQGRARARYPLPTTQPARATRLSVFSWCLTLRCCCGAAVSGLFSETRQLHRFRGGSVEDSDRWSSVGSLPPSGPPASSSLPTPSNSRGSSALPVAASTSSSSSRPGPGGASAARAVGGGGAAVPHTGSGAMPVATSSSAAMQQQQQDAQQQQAMTTTASSASSGSHMMANAVMGPRDLSSSPGQSVRGSASHAPLSSLSLPSLPPCKRVAPLTSCRAAPP